MNMGGPLFGAVSGLLLAVILVAGVSIAGGGSLHLDLAGTAGNGLGSNGASALSGASGGSAVAPQTSVGTTQASSARSGASPISSLNGLTSQSGGSVALLLFPVALGAFLGALFYLAYNRRIDIE
ncbi:MAG: hypothetical protein ABSA72_05195 [Nitrososphaerales archaeon]|jgi:hypothetical protein